MDVNMPPVTKLPRKVVNALDPASATPIGCLAGSFPPSYTVFHFRLLNYEIARDIYLFTSVCDFGAVSVTDRRKKF